MVDMVIATFCSETMMRYHMMFYVMITVYTVLAGKCGLLVKMLC